MQENYDIVQKGFRTLHPMLAGYIDQELNRVYGNNWWKEVLYSLSDQNDLPTSGSYKELIDSLDIPNCLRLFERKDSYDNLNEKGLENCYKATVKMLELIDRGLLDQLTSQ